MPCPAAPRFDYAPLRDALAERVAERRVDYKTVSGETGVPFPKLIKIMSLGTGAVPEPQAVELVNLARYAGIPLCEVVRGEADGADR